MRKATRYRCELCGATYETEKEARECVMSHKMGIITDSPDVMVIVKQVELTDECIQRIAEAVTMKLRNAV